MEEFYLRRFMLADMSNAKVEKDIIDFIYIELNDFRVSSIYFGNLTPILVNKDLHHSQKITIPFIILY